MGYYRTVVLVSLVGLLAGCKSEAEKRDEETIARLRAQIAQRAAEDSARADSAKTHPALAKNPCDGPRPYKKWTNAQLNAAQVQYMGTPQSEGLIAEASCRL